jgi:protein-disulfide isomerase
MGNAVPPAASAAGATSAELRRRRRARLLGLGVVVGAVAAGVVVLITTGGAKPATTGAHGAASTVAAVESLLDGIPQKGNSLGNPSAPVTLVYFGDLECPFCREFTLDVLPSIIQNWVRTGKLQIEYRSMETATREPAVFKTQQVAALAAGRQNKMWYFLELFYHEQGTEDSGYVTEQYLQGLAKQVRGLNLPQWMSDRNDTALVSQVLSDMRLAKRLRFPGTPSLFFGRTGGHAEKYHPASLTNPKGFGKEIESLLGPAA